MAVLTRRETVGKCPCKVGALRQCGSSCRRCKCSCDGVSPLEAMKRYQSGKRSKKGNHCQRRKPKRLKIDDLLLPEPKRRKRRNKDDDDEEDSEDLEFTPTLSIVKPNGDVSTLVCEEASELETTTNEGEAATATI